MGVHAIAFKYRSYTPIPLALAVLILSHSTWTSFTAGMGLVLIGEALRFWGVLYAGSATRTTGEVGACRLVTDGPFAHMRNPLYTGNFIMSFGLLVMAWAWMPWMALVFVLLFWLQYTSIVNLEEEFLRRRFGEAYTAYCARVPRWFFRWKANPAAERSNPVFWKALKSERNTLQAIVAMVSLILIRWHLL
jgi:protein-S-isoprenylcysteine O-methyltransferase Ste14